MSTEGPASDKWTQRRTVRRGKTVQSSLPLPPVSVECAYFIWMLFGIPCSLLIVGIVMVVKASHLRSGYRSARVVLSLLGLPCLIAATTVLLEAFVGVPNPPVWPRPLALLIIGLGVIATVVMWLPSATSYFDAMDDARDL